ncbi:MAG TPA: YciI family protein [Trebonia sp.]|nr:YciI family protein [Trebonia sp.]
MAVFAVRTARAAGWDRARGIRDQPLFDEHAAFSDSLVASGVIILGGPLDSDDPDEIALLAVRADSPEAARAAFAADPWIVHGIFRLSDVRRWTIWLDGRQAGQLP